MGKVDEEDEKELDPNLWDDDEMNADKNEREIDQEQQGGCKLFL